MRFVSLRQKPAAEAKSAIFAVPDLPYFAPSGETKAVLRGEYATGERTGQQVQQAASGDRDDTSVAGSSPRFAFGFGQVPVYSRAEAGNQPKLALDTPGDVHEQEDDRVHEVLDSAGQPLDTAARVFMESRFGYDFGQVRIHTDAKAAESARMLGARAYTAFASATFVFHGAVPFRSLNTLLLCI